MKPRFIACCLLALTGRLSGQILVSVQTPATALCAKSQLWNLSLVNTGNDPILVSITLSLTDLGNNQQVFSASSRTLTLSKGVNIVSTTDAGPIQYNAVNPNYPVDASPDGLLPAGHFTACYSVYAVEHEGGGLLLTEQCEEIFIEPLSPPILVLPADSDHVDQPKPVFTWTPPMPMALFAGPGYRFVLTEVLPTQSAADAIEQNLPIVNESVSTGNTFSYPAGMSGLDTGKLYAWRVTATNNGADVSSSDTWTFRVVQLNLDTSKATLGDPYSALHKTLDDNFALCTGKLHFVYKNEINDTLLPFRIFDITAASQHELILDSSGIDIRYGDNYKEFDFTDDNLIKDGHIYLLEITNSRQEIWYLKFQFRKPD